MVTDLLAESCESHLVMLSCLILIMFIAILVQVNDKRNDCSGIPLPEDPLCRIDSWQTTDAGSGVYPGALR